MNQNLFVSTHPLVLHKITKLRDRETDPKKFRELVRELAALLGYEATQDLLTQPLAVQTPLAPTTGVELKERIGLIPILRAGLGMVEGIWTLMPGAEVWHIGLYRDEKTLQPVQYYNKLPNVPTVTVCLILDPMLATGGSAIATIDILKKWGAKKIKFVGLIGAPEGVNSLSEAHPDVPIYLAALDERLTGSGDPWPTGYIMPGLGDAGDRQFGTGNRE
ncbi:uracil phosphoribosyltransferase [candidate division CPR3 bacterium GWF2_35_18]|uniref:Uracil phosphoribosyltransferase n=1 Tax=candidate division CPR3 bacterium GW2011_GWF2_35_18 TaxID=1618350 RepID=A0A0G0BKV0_UNCC3|nr:MAG: Uracil phosphoribosyltransferase [candidate division CPR3 bacterium GW2011_GWF2_35_18]KKP85883.1 MAG: Uracil phosphoribosyltransferase [candidate division CPR3 bacterium GW2011_GWE2_35_7]OGB63311.1 MAG: uracil phosphoribosyltransferase [candidate division CPR3 bacterium GWF2_35_18]OGB65620.1 MAG: uracil phosphoribosyltransferase [candidate division CPR3 bacterium RIFOXYA2_FULL_35_13]OGB79229.1 MAG: uracil phosphoribosyltransferase [candidate division CPR3 bacterium RIFOXYB2_FULL_35_8]O